MADETIQFSIKNENDEEMKKIIDGSYASATRILQNNVEKLHAVAQVLLEKEKITGEEFEAIFNN